MINNITKCLIIAVMLMLPTILVAQQKKPVAVYDMRLVKQEPTLESVGEKPSFTVSPQTRGMNGLNGVVLWVETDNKSLAAYQGKKLLWKTNVVEPFTRLSGFEGTPEIRTIVSQSSVAIIFVQVGKNGFAEVDRKTGRVSSADITED